MWLTYLEKDSVFHHWLRQQKDIIFMPLAKVCTVLGIGPNAVTIIGALLGVFSVGLLLNNLYWWFVVVATFSVLMDGVDGATARFQKVASSAGGKLDLWSDTVVMVLTFIGLTYYLNNFWWLGGLLLFIVIKILLKIIKSPVQLLAGRLWVVLPCIFGFPVIGLGLLTTYAATMGCYGIYTTLHKVLTN